MTAEACKTCAVICGDCPRPRLLPQCEPLVLAYLDCRTQWRTGGMGGRTGMDYPAVLATLETLHPRATPKRRRRLFDGVRVIEAALLDVQREAAEAEAPGK